MWDKLPVPFNKGLTTHEAEAAFQRSPGVLAGENLDFSKKGAVRGRLAWIGKTGYTLKSLDGNGREEVSQVTNLSDTGFTGLAPFVVKDTVGERPGLIARGRAFIHDGVRWNDAGPSTPMRVKRLRNLVSSIQPFTVAGFPADLDPTCGAAWDIGPMGLNMTTTSVGIMDTDGRVVASDAASAASLTDMSYCAGARCGQVSGLVVKQPGTNNLALVLHTAGSTTVTTIAPLVTDHVAGGLVNETLLKPSICADFDSGVFFIAYHTNVARTLRVLRVSTAGAILASQTYLLADEFQSVWISNTDVATNRLVVVVGNNVLANVRSKILNATTLADQALDATHAIATEAAGTPEFFLGQVVVGVVDSDNAVIGWTNDTTGTRIGHLSIARRRIASTTNAVFWTQRFHRVRATSTEHFCAGNLMIQHQPVVVSGRILMGLATVGGVSLNSIDSVPSYRPSVGATWYVVDITELWRNGTATGVGNPVSGRNREPVIVAVGPRDGSSPPFVPKTAMVSATGDTYRFASVDWTDVFPAKVAAQAQNGFAHPANVTSSLSAGFRGDRGALALNELSFLTPQYASFGENTILAGSCPTMISGSMAHPVGFPYLDRPCLQLAASGAVGPPGMAVGSYGVYAIWSWTDSNGRVHRSAPSNFMLVTTTAVVPLTFNVTAPVCSGRPPNEVYLELYCSQVNPTAQGAHYLQSRVVWPNDGSASMQLTISALDTTTAPVLYTLGGVLTCQTPRADGGVATVGDRCWVSDGTRLYASRLGDEQANNEAPSWHVDDTLLLNLPVSSGRVVALLNDGDKLVVLTETGVWLTTGVGPNDFGQGPAFAPPLRVANVGVSHQRACCVTKMGVVFQANHTGGDGTFDSGGLWVIQGDQSAQISAPVREAMVSDLDEVAYIPTRDLLVWSGPNRRLVYDMRVQQWNVWSSPAGNGGMVAEARGAMWALISGVMATTNGTRGQDNIFGLQDYPMKYRLHALAIGGSPGQQGRCRSVKLIGEPGGALAPYDVTVDITLDRQTGSTVTHTHDEIGYQGPTLEVHLPAQKCSLLTVALGASAAFDTWTGVELLVKRGPDNKQGTRRGAI